MVKTYSIYTITNKVNNKLYVGRTTQNVEIRWNAHKRGVNHSKNQKLRLYRAFKKYGIENFDFRVIDTCHDFDTLKKLEKYYINLYKTLDHKFGYNMSIDCDNGLEIFSEESISRRRVSMHKTHANKQLATNGIGVRCTSGNYYANIRFNNKNYNIPAKDVDSAKVLYDKLASYLYNEDAVLNFPDRKYDISELQETFNLAESYRVRKYTNIYKGVYFVQNIGKYSASINKDKKLYKLGNYESAIEAAKVVDIARVALYNRIDKKINFPELLTESHTVEWCKNFIYDLQIKLNPRDECIKYDARIEKYFFIVSLDGKNQSFGYYDTKDEAIAVRDMYSVYFNEARSLILPEKYVFYIENNIKIIEKILISKRRCRGIVYNPKKQKFYSTVMIEGKVKRIGTSSTYEEAVKICEQYNLTNSTTLNPQPV